MKHFKGEQVPYDVLEAKQTISNLLALQYGGQDIYFQPGQAADSVLTIVKWLDAIPYPHLIVTTEEW